MASLELAGEGYLGAIIESSRSNFEVFHRVLASQVYAILRDGISADELDRAKGPLRENAVKQLESNAYWESRLALRLRDERMDGPILGAAKDVEAVSAEDVASLLRRIVVERAPVRIEAIAKQ